LQGTCRESEFCHGLRVVGHCISVNPACTT
jgi:hypothetical protein